MPKWLPPFAVFLVIGALASLINVATRVAIGRFVSFELSVALAFPVALTFAYLANRALVFRAAGASWRSQYAKFLIVNLFALAQVWLISVLLVKFLFPYLDFTWHAELIGHGVGVASPVLTSYYAHKHYSFKA